MPHTHNFYCIHYNSLRTEFNKICFFSVLDLRKDKNNMQSLLHVHSHFESDKREKNVSSEQ